MSDATSVLFGLEDEFRVLEVQRVDNTTVKVIIEQAARAGPCPECGVFSGTVKDRPMMRLKDSAGLGADRPAVVAEAPADLWRGAVPA
jgi:transposase